MRIFHRWLSAVQTAVAALLIVAGVGLSPNTGWTQGCCSPSTTPVSALQSGPAASRSVDVGVYYEYFRLRGNLQGTSDVPDPQERLSELHIANFAIGYTPFSRLGFRAILPIARRSREQTLSTPTLRRRDELIGSGLSDLSLLAQGRVLPLRGIRPFDVSVGVGAKIPTGGNRQEANGVLLPLDLQPGTGATDLLLTSYGQFYGWSGWNVFAGHVWRVTGTNGEGYRFGNELQVFGGAIRTLSQRWSFTLETRYRHATADHRNFGTRVPSTGNDRVYLAPGAAIRLGTRGPSLLASVLIPAYEQVRGTQLGTRVGLNLALQTRFSIATRPSIEQPR